ncbi:MAG TPA: AAA family ATPase [Ktedonobacteraceae bacterium]|nr:AAA family ATPase [Ktedonobacteraceae bacterium]
MSTLKIALLGPPEVDHGDYRLAFPDRKVLALLAYLAAEGGVHERQKLTRLLWPESDMAHGRTALRITLLHLRHILEEDASPERDSHLLITHNTLGLDLASGIDLDLHALQTAWKLVRALRTPEAVQGEVRRTLIARLQHAAALYRGGFLQDFTLRNSLDFDNWVGMQQGYWYQRIEQVFDWLSQLQRAEGALEQAIATVERWRSFDPLNEDISLRLMQLQFASGNRIGALKTYETCVEVLMTELSAKPSAKLVAMAEMLRKASLSHGAHNGVRQRTSTARPLLDVPFVGRGAEFSRLMTLYEHASCGQPQVVLLEGEAGIGKTRLAAEFLAWVRVQGADVLEGRTYSTSLCLPFQPLLEALRARLEQEPDLRQWLGDPWLAELSCILPDLREHYPDLPPPAIDGAFASCRLFEALARLSQALAAQAPLLIFADDMQLTDTATLDVFQYLARYWVEHATPAMLLLSRRTETHDMEPQMSEWLARLRSTISLTRLELGLLSAKDLLQITRSLSGVDGAQPSLQGDIRDTSERYNQPSAQHVQAPRSILSPERFGAWLFAETKGQPFYLKALLQTQLERGFLVPSLIAGSGWVFEPLPTVLEATPADNLLPVDVRELIERRLARLSSPARNLLAAGAVLGHVFTFEELCQVAQLAPQDGLAALDEVLQGLLLFESSRRREGSSGVSYHFAHDKIRQVVYAAAGDARRRVFHSRAYGLGVRGHPHRGAGLLRARRRISNSYISEGYDGRR